MNTVSPYFTYMIRCADDTYYIGITNNIEKRLKAHNGKILGGAKYTRFKRPVELVYSEEYQDRSQASKREYELKKLTREEKHKLITPI